MIRFHVSYENPLTSYITIRMQVEAPGPEAQYLQLPAWRPGRYELQHFAQKIQKFSVYNQNGQPLPFRKVTKDRWLVQTQEAEILEVVYTFYARQMDAGGSWLDESQLYINGVNCFLAAEGKETEPHELALQLPEHWQIACGMPAKENEPHTLLAENYEQLVDSPLIASATLQHEVFHVDNIPFHIWIQGSCRPDWNRIVRDFTAYTIEQLNLFGDFPVTEYHYLNHILPYQHYHGVEHSNSTVVTLGPAELLMTDAVYKEFLGVSSHELFHTWNIKKIRPAEMMPYDYRQENYFRTGYVAEGITTYYGDYMLARSGVFNAQQYFEELNTVLAKHYTDHGRDNLSVADSSFDLWLDGYKPGIPDRKVSIYHKGALACLILDLEIRRATRNHRSMDDVLRHLWLAFGKTGKGYTEADYAELADRVAGISFKAYFDEIINGTVPLEGPLHTALQYVGCALVREESAAVNESYFGFKVLPKEQNLTVAAIAPGSPAADALSLEDELVAINGRKIENGNLQALLQPQPLELTLFRQKQLRTVLLQPDDKRYYEKYLVRKDPQAGPEQRRNFELWLKQPF